MTLQSDITEQRRKHGRVLHLVHEQIQRTKEELEFETSLEVAVEKRVYGLTCLISDLSDIARHEKGAALIERSLEHLAASDQKLSLLIGLMLSAARDQS